MVSQDPVVSRAKLVAEPWDAGPMGTYDLGRFPSLWREWNGKYRDRMRDFWRRHPVGIGEFATRFSGHPACAARSIAVISLAGSDPRRSRSGSILTLDERS